MQLSLRSNHAMRLLMYCAAHGPRTAPVSRIARTCNVSEAHLAKIAHHLSVCGFVETLRGRGGGVRLARDPAEISIGAVLRATEAGPLVGDCDGEDACDGPLSRVGRYRCILDEALGAFFTVLDSYTLADLVREDAAPADLLAMRPTAGSAGVAPGLERWEPRIAMAR